LVLHLHYVVTQKLRIVFLGILGSECCPECGAQRRLSSASPSGEPIHQHVIAMILNFRSTSKLHAIMPLTSDDWFFLDNGRFGTVCDIRSGYGQAPCGRLRRSNSGAIDHRGPRHGSCVHRRRWARHHEGKYRRRHQRPNFPPAPTRFGSDHHRFRHYI
jgi:hypothetical protein